MERGTPDRTRQQVANPVLQNPICWKPDGILDPLGFEVLVDIGIGKVCVGAEIEVRDLAPIASYNRLQHILPAVRRMDVAGTKCAAFEVAEPVEHEQRMIAGAFVMTVPKAHLLLAMGGADTRIHIEHNAARRASAMNPVDPLAEKIGERREVLRRREPTRLKASHLAW